MKKIIFFVTMFCYASLAYSSDIAKLEKKYSDLSAQIKQCKDQKQLKFLKQQRNDVLEQMSYQNDIPAASNVSLSDEFDRFKEWFKQSFILENHQYHVMQQVEKLYSQDEKTDVQLTTLQNFFSCVKSARLKLELLSIGSFYVGEHKALVVVPITSVQRLRILFTVIKTLSEKLASCWENQQLLEKQCNQKVLHACVVDIITATMPSSCKTSWIKRWSHAVHKKLSAVCFNFFDSQVSTYDALSYDLAAHHTVLCDNVVTALTDYQLCQHENKTARIACKKKVQMAQKALQKKRQSLACKHNQQWNDRVAGIIIALLETRLEHINHVLGDYDKPGFYKLAQDDVFEMHDRLKMLFNEYSVLRKKTVADFFSRYNKIVDRYKQDVLDAKQPSEKLYQEILSLVVALRELRPGFIKSLVWGSQTTLYFLDGMVETLEKIDPRVKESSVIDQFVQRALNADQSGLSNKIVKNVLGSEVITNVVLKQLMRVVEFLQNNKQSKPQ